MEWNGFFVEQGEEFCLVEQDLKKYENDFFLAKLFVINSLLNFNRFA